MMDFGRRALVLAPHTDDGEIGCGGTVAKLLDQGCEVHYAAFSSCDESLPPQFHPGTLREEVMEATKRLGIEPGHVHLYDYPVRRFDAHRQDILEDMVKLSRELQPEAVFTTSRNDIHQDHVVVACESLRAFKEKTILAYELPWNNLVFETRGFSLLSTGHLERKLHALDAYESQKTRKYFRAEFIEHLAAVRGSQVKAPLAEVFDVVRCVF